MSKRDNHIAKSTAAKEAYARYLKNVDCEPTVNDQIALSPSTEGGEELREPTSKRRRPVSAGQKLQDHFQEHWVEWLFGGVVAIVVWLMLDARVDLSRIEANAGAQKDNITDLKDDAKLSNQKNQEQDLTLREHSVRLSVVEKTVGRTKE